MSFAHIVDNAVRAYPYSLAQMKADNPDTSFPRDPTPQQLAALGLVRITETKRPAATLGSDFIEGTPALVGRQWRQTWVEMPVAPEEQARRAEIDGTRQEIAAAKKDKWLTAFLDMTPAGAGQFVRDGVSDIESAREMMAKLAYTLRVLARKDLRR